VLRACTPFLLIASALSACTSDSSPTLPDADFFVSPGQLFALRVGDTAAVVTASAFVLVRFNGVFGDSRCPQGVECVTAGHATVVLTVQTALALDEVSFEVPPQGGTQQVVREVTVEILELRPAAQGGVRIDPLSYLVGMRVLETGSIPLPQ
jgi:hypothetical protein